MKLAVIAFTRSGCRLAQKIREAVTTKENECEIWGKGKEALSWGVPVLEESLREWTGRQFASQDALLYIGAAGIAVRAIALCGEQGVRPGGIVHGRTGKICDFPAVGPSGRCQ